MFDFQELNSENSDAVIESFSPSPIPIEDSDSLIEEIDIFLAPDDSIPPSIKNDDYYSEGIALDYEDSHARSFCPSYQILTKGQKQSQNRQNQAWEWKEHEESKPKICAS
ncbi:hypothetical protein Tco_1087902 [Tanacetum coccineum]